MFDPKKIEQFNNLSPSQIEAHFKEMAKKLGGGVKGFIGPPSMMSSTPLNSFPPEICTNGPSKPITAADLKITLEKAKEMIAKSAMEPPQPIFDGPMTQQAPVFHEYGIFSGVPIVQSPGAFLYSHSASAVEPELFPEGRIAFEKKLAKTRMAKQNTKMRERLQAKKWTMVAVSQSTYPADGLTPS